MDRSTDRSTDDSAPDIEAAADALFSAREARRTCEPIAARFGIAGAHRAYAVQNLNTERWNVAGRRIVGRKIGLTSASVQRQLGVDRPDYGMLYADMEHADGDTVPFDSLIQPRAEAEIAFVMARAVDDPELPLSRLLRAVEFMLPAIEIADSAVVDWQIGLEDTIADNASSGCYLLGRERRSPGAVDLDLAGMALRLNGEIVAVGAGAACLGHPLNAALWLARTMAARERPLGEGDLILSGALGPMAPLSPGDAFEAAIGGVGRVSGRLSSQIGEE